MPYRLLGLAHATAVSALTSTRRQHGQGTVEYVALIYPFRSVSGLRVRKRSLSRKTREKLLVLSMA